MDEIVRAAVFGERYANAVREMQLIEEAINARRHSGFDSDDECAQWAAEHHLDIVMYCHMSKGFFYIGHDGKVYTDKGWRQCYCHDVCFINDQDEKGKPLRRQWMPRGYAYFSNPRVEGETSQNGMMPLYHRDYHTPTNYFDPVRGTFNSLKTPFPVFAEQTGRDTGHIYRYIEAVAGECSMHLLAWLRHKLLYPSEKTEVMPIFVSKVQGTGKTTFAKVICRGLFGTPNVIVDEKVDTGARFNADIADALIICIEENDHENKRVTSAALKSCTTNTTIRKENKGRDPVYQESYTEYIMTSNKEVPIKFEDSGRQRRFMVMEADSSFTRDTSELADEVFAKLYGIDRHRNKINIPFTEDVELRKQFIYELVTREDIAKVDMRDFPETAAYKRCYNVPRTNESITIENIMRSLAPFIAASLREGYAVKEMMLNKDTPQQEMISISHYLPTVGAMAHFPPLSGAPAYVALCRTLVFQDAQTGKPLAHSNVERALMDMDQWLTKAHGIRVLPISDPLVGGFFGVASIHRNSPTARFVLATERPREERKESDEEKPVMREAETAPKVPARDGERLRVNGFWAPDPDGEFETVNEMKPGVNTLKNKTENVRYMDTFLFEADSTTKVNYQLEMERIENGETDAEKVFSERLRLQLTEAKRLFNSGIACRIVYSGGKSYHILVRVEDAPSTVEEYKWLHAHLCGALSSKLVFDQKCCDPARLTRAPITFERSFEYANVTLRGTQKLVDENWDHTHNISWRGLYRQWRERPLALYERQNGKRLPPSKQEYKDAMLSLLSGTFWTDSQWNGRRNQVFFPAYRLCRTLGYTHDYLWAEGGILDGLEKYYKKSEIHYWRSREDCDLIAEIDLDVGG